MGSRVVSGGAQVISFALPLMYREKKSMELETSVGDPLRRHEEGGNIRNFLCAPVNVRGKKGMEFEASVGDPLRRHEEGVSPVAVGEDGREIGVLGVPGFSTIEIRWDSVRSVIEPLAEDGDLRTRVLGSIGR